MFTIIVVCIIQISFIIVNQILFKNISLFFYERYIGKRFFFNAKIISLAIHFNITQRIELLIIFSSLKACSAAELVTANDTRILYIAVKLMKVDN